MQKIISILFALTLLGASDLYEVRWDGVMCTITGGGDRRLTRKTPRDGVCQFQIPAQKQCQVVGFSNAKTLRYDGKQILLAPIYEKEPALGDMACETVR